MDKCVAIEKNINHYLDDYLRVHYFDLIGQYANYLKRLGSQTWIEPSQSGSVRVYDG